MFDYYKYFNQGREAKITALQQDRFFYKQAEYACPHAYGSKEYKAWIAGYNSY